MAKSRKKSRTPGLITYWVAPHCDLTWAEGPQDVPLFDPSRGWWVGESLDTQPNSLRFQLKPYEIDSFPCLVRQKGEIDANASFQSRSGMWVLGDVDIVEHIQKLSMYLDDEQKLKSKILQFARGESGILYYDEDSEWGDTSLKSWKTFIGIFSEVINFLHFALNAPSEANYSEELIKNIKLFKNEFETTENKSYFYWAWTHFMDPGYIENIRDFSRETHRNMIVKKLLNRSGMFVETGNKVTLTLSEFNNVNVKTRNEDSIMIGIKLKSGVAQYTWWKLAQVVIGSETQQCPVCGIIFLPTRGGRKSCGRGTCSQGVKPSVQKKRQLKSVTTASQPHP